ncbi:SMI1/KNR4 family protein [Nocardia sp. NPDC047038]|uniref:SMI1/KNR4 family protein n=1 Tax=Nocardia sp. NPDC047038 TaxID=3154338 RepID=UPI0033F6BC77
MWDRAEILERLAFLRRADTGFTRFGAIGHRYLLNQPLAECEVTAFETRHGVALPEDYRSFIRRSGTEVRARFTVFSASIVPISTVTMRIWCPGFSPGAFPQTRSWNELGNGTPEAEEEYFDPSHIRGSLNVSHQGCGYMIRLVLNGPQRGTLWEDGRCSDGGVSPFAPGFADWYLRWLNQP